MYTFSLLIIPFFCILTNAQSMYLRWLECSWSYLNIEAYFVCTPDVCNKHGTCIPNVYNSFTCQCHSGFVGPTCNKGSLHWSLYENLSITNLFVLLEIDECASSPCANNGTCTDLENGFLCHCLPEWNGNFCTETKSRCSSTFNHEEIRRRL